MPIACVMPDAEHEQVPQRIEQIPEDERQVRRANLAFAIHDGRQGAHEGTCRPAAVSSMKISSRLAPDTSILSTRPSWSRELGAEGLNTFAEVHAYAFTAGILLQFTSMICQGVPVRLSQAALRLPGDRRHLAALLFGPSRRALGETRRSRGSAAAERKTQRLGAQVGSLFQHRARRVAIAPDHRLRRRRSFCLGVGHSPLGLREFPGNLEHLRNHAVLSEDVKEKILYKNAKRLFNL